MRVIGTAGHVDHGKSTLVKTLTGTDPDRLKEEKERQMTIDLGFAFFNATDGELIGIVDVPGHRDFIENMLAGVGGIDAVLLVIAADEGVMPQTREHLAIIDLLKIKNGIVVITKIDLIDDPEWLEMVENDIKSFIKGTCLEKSKIVKVSSISGKGINVLKTEISRVLSETIPPRDYERPRLPVDRVFSIRGFGTVVTGTLTGGSLHSGDTVQVLVSGKMGRIRGLQSHNRQVELALPGSRTAINISGLDLDEIQRGDIVSLPGMIHPTRRIDAWVEVIKDATSGLRHNDFVKIFLFTFERVGRIRLLGKSEIAPGDSGWVQIEFEHEIAAERNDHFILRRLSPAETLGGGIIVNVAPGYRYKLNDPSTISRLEARMDTSPEETLFNFIEDAGCVNFSDIQGKLTGSNKNLELSLGELTDQQKIIRFQGKSEDTFITKNNLERTKEKLLEILKDNHDKFPLRPGMPIEELKQNLKISEFLWQNLIQTWLDEGLIKTDRRYIALSDFLVKYTVQQAKKLESFFQLLENDPFNPPGINEIKHQIGPEVFQSLVDQAKLILVTKDIAFRDNEFAKMLNYVITIFKQGNELTVAQFRDHFSTSRKFALAFLEYLDQKKITERIGEGRQLQKGWESIVTALNIH